MIGKTLAHYEILAKIGQGGMGEVYRALDITLDREVALKVLPAEMATDPQRLERFEREAKAVAALKHPNIVTIYSVEKADGVHFLTMELVEGRTLSKILPRDGHSLESIFEIAIPLTEAVGSAHAKGITHRDLKPDNIMIDDEGRLRVLDFGLAKLQELETGDKTLDMPAGNVTDEGVILGTVAYMSPEQAEGKPVDPRSDIFSLGTILYEMATGARPFQGDTSISTIGSILKDEPTSITVMNPATPRHMGRIIRRCLAKDPDRRYQTVVDLRNELEGIKEEIESGEFRLGDTGATAGSDRTGGRRLALGIVVLAIVAVGVGFGISRLVPGKSHGPVLASGRQPLEMSRLTHTGKAGYDASISPDGKYVVYNEVEGDGRALRLLHVNTGRSVQIVATTENSLQRPTFSPDGDFVYYVANTGSESVPTLFRIPVLGGPSIRMIEDVGSNFSFSPDGNRIVFLRTSDSSKNELVVADLDGRNERVISTRSHPEEYHRGPDWSPDGKTVAVGATRTGHKEFHLVEVPAEGGPERMISDDPWGHIENLAWLPDGSGIVMQAIDMKGANFHLWEVRYEDGSAREITSDLNSYSGVSLTADGNMLVTQLMNVQSGLWMTRKGEAAVPVRTTAEVQGNNIYGFCWTPEGKIVYGANSREGKDLWITEPVPGQAVQLTTGGESAYPSVSPDGRYICFVSSVSDARHIWRMDAEGGNAHQLTFGDGESRPQYHPEGHWVYFLGEVPDGYHLFRVSAEGGDPERVSYRLLREWPPAISPDGKMVAVEAYQEDADNYLTEILQIDGGASVMTLNLDASYYRFSLDGENLEYTERHDGVGNVWSQPLGGGPPIQLTYYESELLDELAWSPDGELLAVERRTVSWDVVLLKHFR